MHVGKTKDADQYLVENGNTKWFNVAHRENLPRQKTGSMTTWWDENANKAVRWADGTYDWSRTCDLCRTTTCKDPIHPDHYRSIGSDGMFEEIA